MIFFNKLDPDPIVFNLLNLYPNVLNWSDPVYFFFSYTVIWIKNNFQLVLDEKISN